MRALPLSLICVILAIASSAPLVPTARAAPLPASIESPLFFNDDATNQRSGVGNPEGLLSEALVKGLTEAANGIFRRTDGWQCMQASYDKSPHLFNVKTLVYSPAPVKPGVWSVSVATFLKLGKRGVPMSGGSKALDLQLEHIEVPLGPAAHTSFEPAPLVIAATSRLREIIAAWTDPVPCKLKSKVKGRAAARGAGTNDTLSWEGEEELSLDQDGKFASTIKIPMQISGTSITGGCRYSGTVDRELRVAGSFRADGSLEFTTMEAVDTASKGTASCGGRELPWHCSCLFDGNWLGEADIAIALEDGAVLRIPRPIGPWMGEWEATLELVLDRAPAPLPRAGMMLRQASLPASGNKNLTEILIP